MTWFFKAENSLALAQSSAVVEKPWNEMLYNIYKCCYT